MLLQGSDYVKLIILLNILKESLWKHEKSVFARIVIIRIKSNIIFYKKIG